MNLFKNVHESWIPLLHSLAYKEPLVKFLSSLSEISFQPEFEKIFKVFEMPVKDIKVVILGQDPYPKPGDAIGRAYAVSDKSKMPFILRNIEKEIFRTKGIEVLNQDNDIVDQSWKTLNHWSEQGVFLLNTTLTVETGSAGSHIRYWKEFTEMIVQFISHENPCIWMLWGSYLKTHGSNIKNPFLVKGYDRESIEEIPIDPELNYIIPGEHPAMLIEEGEEGFSKDGFYYTNRVLEKRSLKKIIW